MKTGYWILIIIVVILLIAYAIRWNNCSKSGCSSNCNWNLFKGLPCKGTPTK